MTTANIHVPKVNSFEINTDQNEPQSKQDLNKSIAVDPRYERHQDTFNCITTIPLTPPPEMKRFDSLNSLNTTQSEKYPKMIILETLHSYVVLNINLGNTNCAHPTPIVARRRHIFPAKA
ncbi:hypothetical protein BLNAU_18869 [Blattamonas nauphoetae]|uniref:Uncharacterized protein n=1 Tax=Blattamonas nauphoetae TaxID=2049346 RepID=A0ABQ9X361_9EUKA|nr:hypothetical protein BLNAU_18869 [Blattamonas nauphoetae]